MRHLIDGHWCVAEDVGLPDPWPGDRDDEIDHDWHELHTFTAAESRPDDERNRDVAGFLQDLRATMSATVP